MRLFQYLNDWFNFKQPADVNDCAYVHGGWQQFRGIIQFERMLRIWVQSEALVLGQILDEEVVLAVGDETILGNLLLIGDRYV